MGRRPPPAFYDRRKRLLPVKNEYYTQADYDVGLRCRMFGLAANDMSRQQLIAFIGMLTTRLLEIEAENLVDPLAKE